MHGLGFGVPIGNQNLTMTSQWSALATTNATTVSASTDIHAAVLAMIEIKPTANDTRTKVWVAEWFGVVC